MSSQGDNNSEQAVDLTKPDESNIPQSPAVSTNDSVETKPLTSEAEAATVSLDASTSESNFSSNHDAPQESEQNIEQSNGQPHIASIPDKPTESESTTALSVPSAESPKAQSPIPSPATLPQSPATVAREESPSLAEKLDSSSLPSDTDNSKQRSKVLASKNASQLHQKLLQQQQAKTKNIFIRKPPPHVVPSSQQAPVASVGNKRKRDNDNSLEHIEQKIKKNDQSSARYWIMYLKQMEKIGQFESLSKAYERATTAFPYSADFWARYIQFQLNNSEFQTAERLFAKCLTKIPNVKLWILYLEYVLRINNVQTGGETARNTIMQAYKFALDHIGIDRDSGPIWAQYIDFLKSKPTQTTWEQQQKMDLIRKAYREAICIPLSNVESLWHGYNAFENGINKTTARKFLSEKSSAYMTARSASKEMNTLFDGLFRGGAPLFSYRRHGDVREIQTNKWNSLIEWEKSNPLGYESNSDLAKRVKYAYKQAAIILWFQPDMWFDAAQYSLDSGDLEDSISLLKIGIEATPTSFLLNYKLAEVYESHNKNAEAQKTYESLIESLKEARTQLETELAEFQTQHDSAALGFNPALATQQAKLEGKIELGGKLITSAYTTYMKSVKRMDGIAKARNIFKECRNLPYASHEIYVASAMMENHNARPDIAIKIFEIGAKRYPTVDYISEYLEFLILINDDTNARALFENSLKKLEGDKEGQKLLYQQFLQYEAEYGELTALLKLESRYRSLYPEESALDMFFDLKELPRSKSSLYYQNSLRSIRKSVNSTVPSTSFSYGSGVSKGLKVQTSSTSYLSEMSDSSGDEDEEIQPLGQIGFSDKSSPSIPNIPKFPSNGNNNFNNNNNNNININNNMNNNNNNFRRFNKKLRHDEMNPNMPGANTMLNPNPNNLKNLGNTMMGLNNNGYNMGVNIENDRYDGMTISTNVNNILKALPPPQTFTLPPFDPSKLVAMLRDVKIPDHLLR